MLSARSISGSPASAAKYYTVGDYYTKGAEETSAWRGQGAEYLSLGSGKEKGVTGAALEAVLAGDLPKGNEAAWKKTAQNMNA